MKTTWEPVSEDDSAARWEEYFHDYKGQREWMVTTRLRWSPHREHYIRFNERLLRWINGECGEDCWVIMPLVSMDQAESRAALGVLTVFVQRLSFATQMRVSISLTNTVASTKRHRSWLGQAAGGLMWPPGGSVFGLESLDDTTDRLDMAVGLFAEGLETTSVFLRFLSFYKVIQLAFDENAAQISAWLRARLPTVLHPRQLEELQKRVALAGDSDEVAYLYKSVRCAIAHVKHSPALNPSSIEDVIRVSADVDVIQPLARAAIRARAGRLAT